MFVVNVVRPQRTGPRASPLVSRGDARRAFWFAVFGLGWGSGSVGRVPRDTTGKSLSLDSSFSSFAPTLGGKHSGPMHVNSHRAKADRGAS